MKKSKIKHSTKYSARYNVGLLGGSFNPAHAGHLHVARIARKRLGLKQVWWLITPRNPLKRQDDLLDYRERLGSVHKILGGSTAGRAFKVCGIEKRYGLFHSWDTVGYLRRRYRGVNFIWLMGADCWRDLPRWYRWRVLFRSLPVAIFARSGVPLRVTRNMAGVVLRDLRRDVRDSACLGGCAGGWVYLGGRKNPISSTLLRERGL